MDRKEAESKYKWDFSHLYKSFEDWKENLNLAQKLVEEICKCKNKLSNGEIFLKYLKLEREKDILLAKLEQYAHLIDIDQTNSQFQEMNSILDNFHQNSKIKTSFILNELKKIGEEKIANFIKGTEFESFSYFFRTFFKSAKYFLSPKQEQLICQLSRSRDAIGSLYDSLAYADNETFYINWEQKQQKMTATLYKEIMEDSDPIKDQDKRIEANKIYYSNFTNRKHSFAKIYEGILQEQIENKNIRKYKNTLEMSLFEDQVSEEIYLKLLEVGKKYISEFRKYNSLIKKKYNIKIFNSTDRLLKITSFYNKNFSIEDSIEIIKKSLSVLGKTYLDQLDIALGNNLIDFYESPTKTQGAYSSGGNGVNPIILMNWDFKLSSLNTLAHELGHSVHTLFSEEFQVFPLNDYPIILAEVASTLNEHLLFEYMFENSETKEESIYLLQQRIFDLISTFYRQIQFADFEYVMHKLVEEDEPLTTKIIMEIFKEKQIEYGYDIFDDNQREVYEWPYIAHFFQSPFYVYKYAIDLVASFKLYSDLKREGNENILNFLKAGGSKEPLEILKDVGVDFSLESTYLPLINEISNLISKLEELIK